MRRSKQKANLKPELLDEFSAANISAHAPLPAASGPGRPEILGSARDTSSSFSGTAATGVPTSGTVPSFPFDPLAAVPDEDGDVDDDGDFAAQLQAGMADLLSEMESSPAMQQQFETMMRELGGAATVAGGGNTAPSVPGVTQTHAFAAAAAAADASSTASGGGPPLSFQETIQRTMERMQNSDSTAQSAAASASQADQDFMATLLREMENGGGGGGMGGEGADEDFSKMLLGMMEQLTNKEILYEPMKELDTKFPDWLRRNRDAVGKDDLARYEEQQRLVGDIVKKFEEPGYSDGNVESRQYIVDKMQKVSSDGRDAQRADLCRCKRPAHPQQIWLVTWRLRRMRWEI
jgi:peroxin-19